MLQEREIPWDTKYSAGDTWEQCECETSLSLCAGRVGMFALQGHKSLAVAVLVSGSLSRPQRSSQVTGFTRGWCWFPLQGCEGSSGCLGRGIPSAIWRWKSSTEGVSSLDRAQNRAGKPVCANASLLTAPGHRESPFFRE